MRFGKLRMFLYLNGAIAIGLMIYFTVWMLGSKTTGKLTHPFYDTKIRAEYRVGEKTYSGSYMRYDVPYQVYSVSLRYLRFAPSYSRVNSFMGIFAEPLAWWLVFLIASSFLLLSNNTVFSKGTVFQLRKKFPWISMDEYFPLPWWYREPRENTGQPASQQPEPQKEIGQNKDG